MHDLDLTVPEDCPTYQLLEVIMTGGQILDGNGNELFLQEAYDGFSPAPGCGGGAGEHLVITTCSCNEVDQQVISEMEGLEELKG